MTPEQLLSITRLIRKSPAPEAAQALVTWLNQELCPAYLMLPDGLLTAKGMKRSSEFVRWLKDRNNWQELDQPEITPEAIFVPLVYAGRTQGVLALDTEDEAAISAAPLAEMLAARFDAQYTASLTNKARQLSQTISQAPRLETLLQISVEGLVSLFNVASAGIYKFEPEDMQGEVIAEHPARGLIGRDMGANDYTRFRQTFAEDILILKGDEEHSALNSSVRAAMRTAGYHQLVLAPMLVANRMIGVLVLAIDMPGNLRQFTGREREILLILAQGIGAAYINARTVGIAHTESVEDTLFRQLIDKANVAIDIHDTAGKVIYRNQSWNELFNASPDEAQTYQNRFPDTDQNMLKELIYPNAERSQGWTSFLTLYRKDKTEFDAHVSVVALRDPQNNLVGYSTITDDVSDMHHVMDSLQHQTTRLAAAASVSQAIITTSDLDELLESVLRLICVQFDYDSAEVRTLSEDRSLLTCVMACDINGDKMPQLIGHRLAMSEDSASRWAITNDRTALILDTTTDERHKPHPVLGDIKSEVILLLKTSTEILGVLIVHSKKLDAFALDDTDLLQSISDQLGIAMYNASLFSQLKERLADMNAMSEVSLLVHTAFDLDALIRRVYEAMRRVHPSGAFSFALYQEKLQQIETIFFNGIEQQKRVQPMADDLISLMIRQSAPAFWRNEEERIATALYFNMPPDELPQSFLGLPIIAKDAVLGVIYTHSDNNAAYDENDLQFLLTVVNSAAFAIENMRLLDDTQRRVREMEVINNISQILSETFGKQSMWDRLLDELTELFPNAVVSIALYEREQNRFILPQNEAGTLILPMPPEALAREIIQNGIMLDFPDLRTADERLESIGIDPFHLNLGQLRAWLAAPLKSRNNDTIGLIALQSDEADVFTEREIRLLTMVTAQIALALDNGRLLQSEQERRQAANSLIDMGRAISASLNIEDVFSRIFEQMGQFLHYDRAAILMLPDEAQKQASLVIQAAQGFPNYIAGQIVHYEYDSPLGRVLHSQEVLLIGNLEEFLDWEKQPEILKSANSKSWMGIPLLVQAREIGLLIIDNEKPYAYKRDDGVMIAALARQAAIAIENAKLHSQAERNLHALENRARRLSSMHNLALDVSSSLAQSDILNRAVRLLTDLFQVDYASIVRIDTLDGHGYLAAEHPNHGTIGDMVMMKGSSEYEAFQAIIRTKEAQIVKVPHGDDDDSLSIKTWVFAPLIAYERVLGNITLGTSNSSRSFDREILDTFMTIAAQIAVAIRNAELFQDALDASRLKSEFLANVSHELRTPLNAIIGYSELLLSGTYGDMTEKQEDRLERVYRSGRQLLMLINDILDLSKIEAGRMELEMSKLDVGMLIQDALSTVQPNADVKNLPIVTEITSDLPPIMADPQRARQILVNLLSNAVKFTKEGEVRLSAKPTQVSLQQYPNLPSHLAARGGTWIHIEVQDTGIGISEQHQRMIFEVFTQADGSSVREYEGTGLGLAITQRLVKLHQGHIWVESTVGEGSHFHLLLPSIANAQQPRYAVDPKDSRPLILIADEDEMTIKLLTEYIDREQYQVISTQVGEELLTMARDLRPALILADLMLPKMEGFEILQRLKDNARTAMIPVILASIMDKEEAALREGAAAYLKKPIAQQQLIDTVASILQIKS